MTHVKSSIDARENITFKGHWILVRYFPNHWYCGMLQRDNGVP